MNKLHTVQINNSNSPTSSQPIVFLHGFGGVADQWWGLQTSLSYQVPTLAFDLPGHGKSINYHEAGPPIVAAKAVLAELEGLSVQKAHFVGHSMGGAVASLIALIAPEKVVSLTLLAPGGFGEELNHELLQEWARAKQEEDLEAVLPQFFGSNYDLPQKVVDFQLQVRSASGATEKLQDIANGLFEAGKQGVLPVSEILNGPFPVSVIWGTADGVLPVSQAEALRGKVDLHIVEDMGHSPAEEEPELVLEVIKSQL